MSDKQNEVLEDLYSHHLKSIQGIKFTRRQIDVISCIVSGWDVKSIAARLSISPSTVETHIDAIVQKLGSGGRNSILTFIENSGKEKYVRQHYQNLMSGSEPPQDKKSPEVNSLSPPFIYQKAEKVHKLKFLMMGFGFFLVCIVGSVFMFQNQKGETVIFGKVGTLQDTIRSELPLPNESTLLYRTPVLKLMDEKLKSQEGIQTIALVGVVGIGGAGKTTLARQYACSVKGTIVWEINAETKESLINSFEGLAYATSKTDEERRELRIIREIKDPTEREKKLLFIVKSKLKRTPNWLLIYDNVEDLKDIKKYFPSDPTVWGHGKVLITTRDANIKNNALFNAEGVVNIETLSSQEQYILFKNILYGRKRKITLERKREIKDFLKNLPPFPLDVSTAAYYIKDTKISFEDYLNRSKTLSDDFENAKTSLLKEMSPYTKTRYGIVTLTLKKLIEADSNFKDLLLFISLLDSQNIPIDLLKSFKKETIVERFIHALRKHSFITSEQTIGDIPTLSLHRSAQAITLAYLKDELNLEKNQKYIQPIANSLEKYMAETTDKENISKMKLLITHGERFLTHQLLIGIPKTIIGNQLGWMYDFLGKYLKAKEHLEQGLATYEDFYGKNHPKTVWPLIRLGNVYGYQGKYRKAKELLERGLIIYEASYGKNHPKVAWLLVHLGEVYIDLGEDLRAKELLERSLIIYETSYGKNYPKVAWVLVYLGEVYRDLGNSKKAKELLERSLTIYEASYGKSHITTAWTMVILGNVYRELGKYREAKALLDRGVVIHEKHFGRNHAETAWTLIYSGNVYRDLNKFVGAKKKYQKGLSIFKNYYGKDHIETAWVLYELGKLNLWENQFKTAKKHFLKSLFIFEQNKHLDSYLALENLGDLYTKKLETKNKPQKVAHYQAKAQNYFYRSLSVLKEHLPKASPHIKRVQLKLNRVKV